MRFWSLYGICLHREILRRYEEGETAKQLIGEAVAPSLGKVVDKTLQQRQMPRELELQKKVEPISKLRKSWGGALKWADGPGNLLMITRNDQRAAMISVETALAMSSMAVDDHTIVARCQLMEMLNPATSTEKHELPMEKEA